MKRRLLIFTDLDGTLMHPETYAYEAAVPVIRELAREGHWVVPVTSKTRAEVEALMRRIGTVGAFVVENGSAIFIPPSSPLFAVEDLPRWGGYGVRRLGVLREDARRALQEIRRELGRDVLLPLSEMDDATVVRLTGLPRDQIGAMRAREFSEPFVIQKPYLEPEVVRLAERRGFRVLRGDRFHHLVGIRAGKGEAVQCLREAFQRAFPEVCWISGALGNAPNDLPMLERVDLAVVVGEHPLLTARGFHRVSLPPPEGWVEGVRWMLQRMGAVGSSPSSPRCPKESDP